VLRAVTIPVAGPIDCDWAMLRPKLRAAFAAATAAANWAVRELSRADHVRLASSGDRMPKMERVYLYPGARAAVPEVDPTSMTSLLQSVERRWRASRLDVVWRRAAAPPSYRYPMPYPMHEASWRIETDETGQRMCASLRLGGERIRLRLRGGSEYRRQLAALARVRDDTSPHGEATLIEQRVSEGSHRGGPGAATRLMLKCCVWMPRGEAREHEGTLHVRTAADSLLVYRIDDGEPRYLHADHVRRWAAEHALRLARLAHDSKHEKRWPAKVRRGMSQRREAWCGKHAARMDTFAHQAAAMIARTTRLRR